MKVSFICLDKGLEKQKFTFFRNKGKLVDIEGKKYTISFEKGEDHTYYKTNNWIPVKIVEIK